MEIEDLYKRYAKKVYQYAYYLSGGAMMAEDITSETFVRAWISINKIRESTVSAYLMAIARNYYYELQKGRQVYVQDITKEHYVNDGSKSLGVENDLQRTLNAMQLLKEKERSALLLKARNELTYQEIAQVLNVTVANAKVLVFRARMKLKKILRDELGET